MHRKNDDVYSYVVGIGSIMEYWVIIDQVLREIPKGGIVSQEEVEIHLGLERNFSAWSIIDFASLDTAMH